MKPRLPAIHSDDSALDGAFQAWKDAIERASDITGGGTVRVGQTQTGTNIGIDSGFKRIVQLSGSGPDYSGQEVYPVPNGGWQTYPGAATLYPIYERNNITGLNGLVVEMEIGKPGDWRFEYIRTGSGSTCDTQINGTVATCHTGDRSGVTVSLIRNGSTIGTTTTNSIGAFLFLAVPCVTGDTFQIQVSKTSFTTTTVDITVTCCQVNVFNNIFLPQSPIPKITVNFHVVSCDSGETNESCAASECAAIDGIEGVNVGCTVDGELVSCTTNSSGDCTIVFDCMGNGNDYLVSASGGECVQAISNVDFHINDSCTNATYNPCVVLPVDETCHCLCCGNPRPAGLVLTDSVYGPVDLSWQVCGDGVFRYASFNNPCAFTGACGCPAGTTSVSYMLECICGAGPDFDVEYGLYVCYSVQEFVEVCGESSLEHCCPAAVDDTKKCTATSGCAATAGGLICNRDGTHALLSTATELFSGFAPCDTPINVVLTFPSTGCATGGSGSGPCLWHGINCPTPYPNGATFTITEA